MPGNPGLLRQDGPQGRFQGRRRRPYGPGCRALLHDRRGDSRQGVAHAGPVPHRRLLGREQHPFGYRRRGDQVFLGGPKALKTVCSSPVGLLFFYAP